MLLAACATSLPAVPGTPDGTSPANSGTVGQAAPSGAPWPPESGRRPVADASVDALAGAQAIWPEASSLPGDHQVALFRHEIDVDERYDTVDVHVFADTRYELYESGEPIGRGPARFDKLVHEYDTYSFTMMPGRLVLAVLVQWAPNIRRSESTHPHLLLSVVGHRGRESALVAVSDASWRGIVSDAWMPDSSPIHEWRLIGPSEILDLRKLPIGWAEPGFADDTWPGVAVVARPDVVYRPLSSIATVESRFEPYLPFVVAAGEVSPGMKLFELIPGMREEVQFTATSATAVTVECVTGSAEDVPDVLVLDGNPVPLARVDFDRPGLLRARLDLSPGTHLLALAPTTDRATSVAISTAGLTLDFPSMHADQPKPGERTLLANLNDNASRDDRPDVTELVLRRGAGFAVLDLGQTRHGRLAFDADGPAGAVLDVGFSERLLKGRPLPYAGPLHPQMSQVDSFILDGASRPMHTIDARAGRYVLLMAHSPDGPVRVTDLRFEQEQYLALHVGTFSSSDRLLDEIWQVGVDTAQVNMLDAYADPWRERGQWWGDAFVIDQVNRVAFGDTLLLRRGLGAMARAFADDGRPPALAPNNDGSHLLDYGMLWVQSLAQYARLHPEDDAFVQPLYGTAAQYAAYLTSFHAADTHLIDLPERHWSENGVIDWPAYNSRNGLSAAMNALYAKTLRDLSGLARQLGHEEDAARFAERAGWVASELNELLLVEGRYKATRLNGELLDAISPHAQAWPLSAGIVPPESRDGVADAALALLAGNPADANIGTYGMYWLLDGLANADRFDEALEVIRAYYGYMLDHGATTWWESFTALDDWHQSLSHGWGAAPTWFLSARVLGAEQTGPGRWQVTPSFAGLAWAEGSIPVDGKALAVRWTGSRAPCSARKLELDVPDATSGEVTLRAVPEGAQVVIDGIAWGGALGLDAPEVSDLSIPIARPGAHVIEIGIDGRCPTSSATGAGR